MLMLLLPADSAPLRPLACYYYSLFQGGLRPCLDKIEGLEWASDSDLLLCAMYKRSLVEVCVCVCVLL